MFCRNNSSSAGSIMSNRGICFDDVLLKPRYSNIESRSEIDLSVRLKNTGKNLSVPIVSSPVDTVTSDHMVLAMHNAGGLGVIHRYNDIETQVKLVESAAKSIPPGRDQSNAQTCDSRARSGLIPLTCIVNSELRPNASISPVALRLSSGALAVRDKFSIR